MCIRKPKALAVELCQKLGHAGENRVVAPAHAVVTGAVLARQLRAILRAAVRQQLCRPLLYRRSDEAVEGIVAADLACVEHFAQTADDAGFRIGESSVQIEYQHGQRLRG